MKLTTVKSYPYVQFAVLAREVFNTIVLGLCALKMKFKILVQFRLLRKMQKFFQSDLIRMAMDGLDIIIEFFQLLS